MLLVMVGMFIIALIIGVPIGFSLVLSALAGLLTSPELPTRVLAVRMFTGIDTFPLLAGVFFILAGEIMGRSGITSRLIKFAQALVGHITGGLAHTNIVASIFFAGISGSAVADTAALGPLEIQMMVEGGYDRDFSTAVTVSSSTVGPIIPPSVIGVIYAMSAGISVAGLFLAGILPGLLLGLALMGVSYYIAKKRKYPLNPRVGSLKEFLQLTKAAALVLVMPLIIVGGILSGVFTATEAGAIAAVYASFVALVVLRGMSLAQYRVALTEAGVTVGTVLMVIAAAQSLSWVLAVKQLPMMMFDKLQPLADSPLLFLLVLNIALLIIGTFMEPGAAIIILVPVLLPFSRTMGIDPIHLGMIVILNLTLGLITPPVGVCLYVGCSIAKISLEQLVAALWPFLLAQIAVLLIVTYVPTFSLLIPKAFGY